MDEIKSKIDALMATKQYKDAQPLIESELAQAYLPPGFLEAYLSYMQEIKAADHKVKPLDPRVCFDLLLQKDNLMVAFSQLKDVALMHYVPEIEQVLNESDDDFVKGLLIELLIEQNIRHTFTMVKDDQDLEFIPMYIQAVQDNPSFHNILKRFRTLFENDNPSVLHLVNELLIGECVSMLPFTLSEDDENPLAFSIVKAVLIALNDEDLWYDIQAQYTSESKILMPLRTFSTL
ncbi:MAG: hypothetical protein GX845_04325 [Erysipelothrix sp.]|jgi:hypothetical protein|nr:hypothetical protein [Erysipelothrix sp.]